MVGENFFSPELRADGISNAAKLYPYQLEKTGEQLFSVLARGVYNYDNRYVLTATFRADGSSKFDKSNRFSYFPSFALAWRINQEKWMRQFDKISNLKLRAGWGQVGNQAISPYQTLGGYVGGNNYATAEGMLEPGIIPERIPNPDLKWETSEQYNVGIDLGFFDQRLTITADAYLKTTKDLLQQIALPYASGYTTMWINNGKIENKGIELTIEGTPVAKKHWNWTIGGNISFAKNTIKELGIAPSDFGMIKSVSGYWGENVGNGNDNKFPANAFLVGHSIGLFVGYQTAGIMQEEEYYSCLLYTSDAADANKNVRKDAFYQAWTPENKSNTYPRLGYETKSMLTDRYIEDGSYLKLSQVSLSYLLNLKKSNVIKNLTFNFTASNVFTITSYSGYDPDVNTFANDVDRMGIDLTSYPSARNFTFGVVANF